MCLRNAVKENWLALAKRNTGLWGKNAIYELSFNRINLNTRLWKSIVRRKWTWLINYILHTYILWWVQIFQTCKNIFISIKMWPNVLNDENLSNYVTLLECYDGKWALYVLKIVSYEGHVFFFSKADHIYVTVPVWSKSEKKGAVTWRTEWVIYGWKLLPRVLSFHWNFK